MAQGEGGGPKTPEGKAVSSRNAVKHGLTARARPGQYRPGKYQEEMDQSLPVVLNVESEEEWLAFEEAILEDLAPDGAVESEIARCVAEWMWVRRRVRVFEKATAEAAQAGFTAHLVMLRMMDKTPTKEDITPEHDAKYRQEADRWLRRTVLPNEQDLARLMKYEGYLTRQINRALWELRLLRRDRERQEPGKTWVEVRHGYDELAEEARGPRG